MQGVASKMAAGGKPTARSVDKADGQETRDDSQDGQEFTKGDRVDHKKFGRGVVTGTLIGRGGDLEIFVQFETVGVKQLLVKFAPLARL
jgi:DNA helicase-2/ATP-dependent DNA helicase PcrA